MDNVHFVPIKTHPNASDLTGQTFGKLTAIAPISRRPCYAILWLCNCACGAQTAVASGNILNGHTTSCGCVWRETVGDAQRTHGMTGTSEYGIWAGILERCQKPTHRQYPRYGGRGIFVCDRWQAFENFIADMGKRPTPQHSIDRIDNDGPYSPENCRWATRTQQSRNQERTLYATIGGVTRPLIEWSEIYGLKYHTVRYRVVQAGWPIEKALTTPPLASNKH